MANFLRLSVGAIFALCLLGLSAAPAYAGCTRVGSFDYCSSRGEAETAVKAACTLNASTSANQYEAIATPTATITESTVGGVVYEGYVYPQQQRTRDTGAVSVVACVSIGAPTRGYWQVGTTPTECELRNSDPEQAPGPALFLDSQVGSRCVAGCTLDIVGDPTEVVQGRVQGQPANFYRFNRQYTGETCEGDEPPGEDEFQETEEDGPQCNVTAGVCVTPEGDTEYCTFNPDGTPSTCVPAVDYDNDGIGDDDDTNPDDPENGADDGEGDESDNEAGGGAKCQADGGQPPTCKGDAIQCNQLLQQYLTRCAAERGGAGKVGGGLACSDSAPLVCTNLTALECWEKAHTKRAACAAEGIAGAISGDGTGVEIPDVDLADAWADGEGGNGEPGEVELDDGGWLTTRTCPTVNSVSVFGHTISFNPVMGNVCDFLHVTSMLILLFAAFIAARILGDI